MQPSPRHAFRLMFCPGTTGSKKTCVFKKRLRSLNRTYSTELGRWSHSLPMVPSSDGTSVFSLSPDTHQLQLVSLDSIEPRTSWHSHQARPFGYS